LPPPNLSTPQVPSSPDVSPLSQILPKKTAMDRRKTRTSGGFQHHLNTHRLTASPPSPGVLHPHAPSLLCPIKFGHEPPENNNIRRYLALCLLHHPFSNKRRHPMPPIPYPNSFRNLKR
ncbi:hypothetical protein AABB24_010471, partial [Solanum stoloniferum]